MKKKTKPFLCGACKRSFANELAIRDHIGSAHRNARNVGIYERIGFANISDEDDESMADRAVQASIDAAMGIHSDDAWLLP